MILVTGATGFLGSQLLQLLVDSGRPLRCIYRSQIPQYPFLKAGGYPDWKQADLLDVASLADALEGVDQVYHCAGIVSFDHSDRHLMRSVNIRGTANLVNACIAGGVKKLLHVSSVSALGRIIPGRPIDETCEWEDHKQNTAYAATKHEAELEVWRGIGEGLNAVIVNPSILIGPSQDWEDASAKLIRNSYHGFPWYTRGVNGFVHVRDVARAMCQLMDHPVGGERFILNGDNWSYKDFFVSVHRNLGKDTVLKYAAPWMGEIIWRVEKLRSFLTGRPPHVTHDMARTASLKIYYDAAKIKRFLPAFVFTPLEETIAETCKAFLEDLTAAGALSQNKDA